jgi:hypothetical protein
MPLVKKLNVVLTIDDELVDSYMSKGYDVIDNSGKVIRAAMPDDLNQLKLLVAKYKKENEELKEKIAKLEAPVVAEAPKRGRKKATDSVEE